MQKPTGTAPIAATTSMRGPSWARTNVALAPAPKEPPPQDLDDPVGLVTGERVRLTWDEIHGEALIRALVRAELLK